MNVQHIPAWKRLGLKLKYANKSSEAAELDQNVPDHGSKRKVSGTTVVSDGSKDEQPQLKRPRIAHRLLPEKLSTEKLQISANTSPASTGLNRKKSVTFAEDTKIEDGDSAKTIQTWVPDKPEPTTLELNSTSNKAEPNLEACTNQKPKKAKKLKTSKALKGPKVAPASKRAPAALGYLHQFTNQRSSWKFNKNHETWILKNALSTDTIPAGDNLALASYLFGLKSEGAKKRLAEQSREALSDEDVRAGESDADLRKDIQQAFEGGNAIPQKANQNTRFQTMGRARLVLVSLGESAKRQAKALHQNGTNAPKAKKNKSRTSRIEMDSSSSSDSDSSEDDSDSSDSKEESRSKTKNDKQPDEVDTSSESSTTSSEETSDSGTDNDTFTSSE